MGKLGHLFPSSASICGDYPSRKLMKNLQKFINFFEINGLFINIYKLENNAKFIKIWTVKLANFYKNCSEIFSDSRFNFNPLPS